MALLEEDHTAQLVDKISVATRAERLSMRPQVRLAIARLVSAGSQVPPKLRRIERWLEEDEFDAMFDNMPV